MSNNNKYRKRFKRLLLLMVLAMVLIFIVSIRPTLKLRQEVISAQKAQVSGNAYALNLQQLKAEQENLNNYFLSHNTETTAEDELFGLITQLCNKHYCVLQLYPPIHTITENSYTLSTQSINIKGGFIDLIKLIHEMENDKRFFIHTVSYILETDRKTGENSLLCELYIQYVSQ